MIVIIIIFPMAEFDKFLPSVCKNSQFSTSIRGVYYPIRYLDIIHKIHC